MLVAVVAVVHLLAHIFLVLVALEVVALVQEQIVQQELLVLQT
jgi:hypothetical protein